MFDPLSSDIVQTAQALRAATLVVAFTGAGVSQESGVPTFRDAQVGLWAQYDPMALATAEAFRRNPQVVWDWYQWRHELVAQAKPNPAHVALAAMESLVPRIVVVTQNIDGLHAAAGSSEILELHGNIHRSKCFAACQGEPTIIDLAMLPPEDMGHPPYCPHCGALVRPDVVWFGEQLPVEALRLAREACQMASVMLVIGTSGEVQPAASLPGVARRAGALVVEINPDATPISRLAQIALRGPAGAIMPRIVAAMRDGG
jgi:NAD-dependent deacetylase